MRRSPRSEVEAETIPVVSRLLEEGAVTQASDANLRRLRECAAAVQRGDHDAAARIAEGLHGLPDLARPAQLRRRLVSLDPATDALLASTGNASAYVRALVADAWSEWTEALAELRAAGWDRPDLLAACDALNGHALLGGCDVGWLWAELDDAERLNGTATRHGVAPAVWAARVEQVQTCEEISRPLWTVAREFWRGNAALERALERE